MKPGDLISFNVFNWPRWKRVIGVLVSIEPTGKSRYTKLNVLRDNGRIVPHIVTSSSNTEVISETG